MWVTGQMNSVECYHDRDARCDSFKEDSIRTATCNSILKSTFASLCSVFQSRIACFCSLHAETSVDIDIALRDESKPDSNSIDCFAVFYIFHAFSYSPHLLCVLIKYWIVPLAQACIYLVIYYLL